MKYKIIGVEEMDASFFDLENMALRALGGHSDNGNDLGLGVYRIDINVKVTNDNNETVEIDTVFETDDRTNGMMNYSGYEMSHSRCDLVQSNCEKWNYAYRFDLLDFLNHDYDAHDRLISDLRSHAEKYAKKELERLLP